MRWIELILNYVLVITAITLFIKVYRIVPKYLKLIGYVLILNFVIEGIAAILMFQDKNNLFLFHFLNPLQFLLYSFYLKAVIKNSSFKKFIFWCSPLLVCGSVFISLKIQTVDEYNSYWLLIQNLTLTLYLLFYFYEQITENLEEILFSKSIFLINIGLFIFSISNLFIGGFLNILIKHNTYAALIIYFISAFVSYITYICFILAFKKLLLIEPKF